MKTNSVGMRRMSTALCLSICLCPRDNSNTNDPAVLGTGSDFLEMLWFRVRSQSLRSRGQ